MDNLSQNDPAEAERLKALGNELYERKEYEGAYHRYTQAIEKDTTNALLYANRAAVHLARKEYFDAAFDCRKAVELDPTYAKAWARLGTATHAVAAWQECIRAWQKALECLPVQNLTADQQTTREQFSRSLARAKAEREKAETRPGTVVVADNAGKAPWIMALALRRRKLIAGRPSCVVVLNYAYEDFLEAMRCLSEQKLLNHPQTGEPCIAGNPNVLQPLTNSILTDERVFHISDPAFFEKINRQCLLENQTLHGWVNDGGAAIMKVEIPERLRTQPWEKVRPAISTTIRTWVFQAFFRWKMAGQHDFAHEMFTETLRFLQWGREQWPQVPVSQRGVVFEKSWIRGVKRQHLNLMHESKAHKGLESPFTYDALIVAAKALIEDVDSDPFTGCEVHKGHYYAFWVYPKAQAKSILGWSILQIALRVHDNDPHRESAFRAASVCYLSAAEAYPTDDDYHAAFLRKHLECLCLLDEPLRVTLPLCGRILKGIPEALEIWNIAGDQLRKCQEQVKAFETHWRREVREGRATMDCVGKIEMPTIPLLQTQTPFMVESVDDSDEVDRGEGSSGAQ